MNWDEAGAGWTGLAQTRRMGASAILGAYSIEREGLAGKMAAHVLVCVG